MAEELERTAEEPERVAEAPERTAEEDLVPTTRPVVVPLLLRLTCAEVALLLRRTVCPPFTAEERRAAEETLPPSPTEERVGP